MLLIVIAVLVGRFVGAFFGTAIGLGGGFIGFIRKRLGKTSPEELKAKYELSMQNHDMQLKELGQEKQDLLAKLESE